MSLYDSVTASNEPDGPGDYGAGYADGRYANWAQVVARFGSHAEIDVTVNPHDDEGNCLDVETGDASPADAPGWTARARARGVKVVWNYCNASSWPEVLDAYAAQRLPLPDRWWIADYTDRPHLPSCRGITADACQYAGGMTAAYDTSCFRPGAFDTAPPAAAPVPANPPSAQTSHEIGEPVHILTVNKVATDANGCAWVDFTLPAGSGIAGAPYVIVAAPGTKPGGGYDTARADITAGAPAGKVRVQITGGIPNLRPGYGLNLPVTP